MRRLLLCCGWLLAACATSSGAVKEEGKGGGADASEYYPMAPGTAWTYEVKLLGNVQEQEVSLVKRGDDGFVQASTGEELLADSYGVRDRKRYLLRNPLVAGTKWTNVVSVSSVEHYEIVAVDQPCEAPAGTWEKCVIVESRNRVDPKHTLVMETTFAPGVGIVKLSTVLEKDGEQIPQTSLTLLKFARP